MSVKCDSNVENHAEGCKYFGPCMHKIEAVQSSVKSGFKYRCSGVFFQIGRLFHVLVYFVFSV